MRKDQEYLDQYFIGILQINVIVEVLQGHRRNRGDQSNKYVDTRDEDEAGRWGFEQVIDRIHQRDHGKTVQK